jgi:hypothetical protein
MADLVLRVRVDPVTGKRELVVDYQSDSDALPMEHEEEHRRLAEKVVEGGLRGLEVTRPSEAPATPETPASERPVATPMPTKR